MMTASRSRRMLKYASPEILREFADVERELARVGIVVPPHAPTDSVAARFLVLMAHADRYDQACARRRVAV